MREPASFHCSGKPVAMETSGFWRWALGDLLSNRTRGLLAEYLVARALGADATPRREWDEVDVRTEDGITVEVKSAAYVQSWTQRAPSKITFGIARAAGWNAATNEYSSEVTRQARVYVFCVLGAKESSRADPLDLDQWSFFVLPTETIDHRCGAQKTIALGSMMRLGPRQCAYYQLGETIRAVMSR